MILFHFIKLFRASKETISGKKAADGFLNKYVNAIQDRNTKELESLLTEDITFFADGGDKVKLVKSMCTGIHEVASLVISNYHRFQTSQSFLIREINHRSAILYYQGNEIKVCQVFTLSPEGKIAQISTILDPEKLAKL